MVPRRRLNWALRVPVYKGAGGGVLVRHTRRHTGSGPLASASTDQQASSYLMGTNLSRPEVPSVAVLPGGMAMTRPSLPSREV